MKLEKELETALDLAIKGGRMLLDSRNSALTAIRKPDGSVVTEADRKVSGFLAAELSKMFPAYGQLDEENSPFETRHKHELCWVTDPLDGTACYLRGSDTFGILIGLMKNFRPVLGVSYRPLSCELVYAAAGEGAYLVTSTGKQALHVSPSESIDVLISITRDSPELEALLQRLQPLRVRQMPSSFKTVEVAKGNATLFLSSRLTAMNLWDLCAPQIILEEAGGRLTSLFGNAIDYSGNLAVREGIIASNTAIHDYVVKAAQKALEA